MGCHGEASGSITLSVAGGTAPYQFDWSNGESTQDLTGLVAGNYQVAITDANGCSFDEDFIVEEPAEAINAVGSVTNVSCYGETGGSINVTVSGGTAPYQFTWSDGADTKDRSDLPAGVYQVAIVDANSCLVSTEFTVTEPAEALDATGVVTHVNCSGETGGTITLSVKRRY